MDRHRRFEIPEGWVARGWQFEVEPTTPAQVPVITRQFGARRFAYNWALAQVKANLDARAADPTVAPLRWSLYDLRRVWNQAKQEAAPWWRECSKEAYACGIADLVADRWFASSKTHHGCGGYRADLRVREREWVCPRCEGLVDRNANAARNLRDWTGPMSAAAPAAAAGMSSVGVVDAPVPCVGDHGGQAHASAWACEAPEDHREVAGADDTSTEPGRGRGTPNRGTNQRAVTDAH